MRTLHACELIRLDRLHYLTQRQLVAANNESIRLGFSRNLIEKMIARLPAHFKFPVLSAWHHTSGEGQTNNGGPSSENRKARNERLQYVACEVHFTTKTLSSRLNLWKSRTLGEGQDSDGLGKQAFYDRLKEAKESGLFAQMQKTHKEDAA